MDIFLLIHSRFHLALGACREIKMAKAEQDDSSNPCCPSCHVSIKPHTPNNGLFTSMFPAVHKKNHYPTCLESSVRWASTVMGIWSATEKSRKLLEYDYIFIIASSHIGALITGRFPLGWTSTEKVKIHFASGLWQSSCSCLLLLCRSYGEVLNCPKITPQS